MEYRLEVERPLMDLEDKIMELKRLNAGGTIDLSREIASLEDKAIKLKKEIFENLLPWDKVQLARHKERPSALDYIKMLCDEFLELHGDRVFSDDPAIIGGFAILNNRRVMIIGHQKGRNTKDNLYRNFGMPNPEGFRKAARLMSMADKFGIPILSFIDTPGAYPGIGAEERGQFLAIARNLQLMATLRVPIVVVIIGEGGSGGALAIGMGNRILILENAVFSVISPEGCASILWRDGNRAPEAAQVLAMTADDLIKLGIADEMIPEPLGGAHKQYEETALRLREVVLSHLDQLITKPSDELIRDRYEKFRRIGVVITGDKETVLEEENVHL